MISENINDVKNSQLNSHVASRGTSFQVSDTMLNLHEEEEGQLPVMDHALQSASKLLTNPAQCHTQE